jgi:hypothetical protein
MSERDRYPNLPADVTIHHCNTGNVMPIEIANKVVELKQLWIHDDAEETEESKEMDGSYMTLRCPHCTLVYTCYLGD